MFNLAAIPPGLCREESRQKPSGQPGHGRPGRWRRQCQSSLQGIKTFALAAPPRCQPQTAPVPPHQRCWRHSSIRGSVPVREDRRTPLQRQYVAHRVGRSGPGPGGRLPSHNVGLFRCSREPCVSLPRRSRARRPSRCQTASRATLHSLRSFRALGHWETLSRASARPASRKGTTSHASPTRLRDSQQPRPTKRLTPQPQCHIERHHPPEREEKGINIYNRRSAACAAPLRFQ